MEKNKIIAVTGYDDEEEKIRCHEAGFNALITKPLNIHALINTMKELYIQSFGRGENVL
jgi:DNA-binding response OmpR family regulator